MTRSRHMANIAIAIATSTAIVSSGITVPPAAIAADDSATATAETITRENFTPSSDPNFDAAIRHYLSQGWLSSGYQDSNGTFTGAVTFFKISVKGQDGTYVDVTQYPMLPQGAEIKVQSVTVVRPLNELGNTGSQYFGMTDNRGLFSTDYITPANVDVRYGLTAGNGTLTNEQGKTFENFTNSDLLLNATHSVSVIANYDAVVKKALSVGTRTYLITYGIYQRQTPSRSISSGQDGSFQLGYKAENIDISRFYLYDNKPVAGTVATGTGESPATITFVPIVDGEEKPDKSITVTANADGSFSSAAIIPGTYQVTANDGTPVTVTVPSEQARRIAVTTSAYQNELATNRASIPKYKASAGSDHGFLDDETVITQSAKANEDGKTLEDINAIIDDLSGQNLDAAIKAAQDAKAGDNFKYATPEKQQALTAALADAQGDNRGATAAQRDEQAKAIKSAIASLVEGNPANFVEDQDKNNLNDAQKGSITNYIKTTANRAGAQAAAQKIADLNTATGNAKTAAAKDLTAVDGYSTNTPQELQNKFTAARQALNDYLTSAPAFDSTNTPEAQKAALAEKIATLTAAEEAIKLNSDKAPLLAEAENLQDEAIKERTKEAINSAASLDAAKQALMQGKIDDLKASPNYKLADAGKADVDALTNTATDEQFTTAKNNLNGDTKLAALNNRIDALSNLPKSTGDANGKDAAKAAAAKAADYATAEDLVAAAEGLNRQEQAAQQAKTDTETTKQAPNYVAASAEKKQAYDDAVEKLDAALAKTVDYADKAAVTALAQELADAQQAVETAKGQLDGEQQLRALKERLKTKLQDKNWTQKTADLAAIDSATSKEEIAAAFATAVEDYANFVKKSNAYKFAGKPITGIADDGTVQYNETGTDTKAAFDAALDTLGTAKAGNDAEAIEAAADELLAAVPNLNGTESFGTLQSALDNRPEAGDVIRQAVRDLVSQAADTAAAETSIRKLVKALNDRTAIQNLLNDVPESTDYKEADPELKTKWYNATNDKSPAYDLAKNVPIKAATLERDSKRFEDTLAELKKLKDELNGDDKLADAKTAAIADIKALGLNGNNGDDESDATDQFKDAIDKINALTSSNDVNEYLKKVKAYAADLQALKAAARKKEAGKNDVNHTEADPAKKKAFDTALQAAKAAVAATTVPDSPDTALDGLTSDLNTKADALNGEHNVTEKRQDLLGQLTSKLTSLTEQQKTDARQAINDATTLAALDAAFADAVDKNLEAAKQAATAAKETTDYKLAGQDVKAGGDTDVNTRNRKTEFVTALDNAGKLADTATTADKLAAAVALQDAKTALNGEENAAKIKAAVKEALTNEAAAAQKDAAAAGVDHLDSAAAAQQYLRDVKALNGALGQLKAAVDAAPQETDAAVTNSSTDKQTAFKDALTKAKELQKNAHGISYPAAGSAGNLADQLAAIEKAATELTNAKENLDGGRLLADAKRDAQRYLAALAASPEKDADLAAVQAASTVAEVKAQQAVGSQHSLAAAITAGENNADLGNKVKFATAAAKQALTDAVAAAKALQSKADATNAERDAAAQKVRAAIAALDGEAELEQAKQAIAERAADLPAGFADGAKTQLAALADHDALQAYTAAVSDYAAAIGGIKLANEKVADVQSGRAYAFAHADKQSAYDAAVADAQNAVTGEQAQAPATAEAVTALAASLKAKKTAIENAEKQLDGIANYGRLKEEADAAIDQLTALDTQNLAGASASVTSREAAKQAIAPNATDPAWFPAYQADLTALNNTLQASQTAVAAAATNKQEPNYTEASNPKKTAYDQAVTALQNALRENIDPANHDAITAHQQKLAQLNQQVAAAAQALDGVARVDAKRAELLAAAKQLPGIAGDEAAQTAAANTLHAAGTFAALKTANQQVAAQALANVIAQANAALDTPDYLLAGKNLNADGTVAAASADQKQAFAEALQAAKDFDPAGKSQSEIDSQTQKLAAALAALNGEENREQALAAIDSMSDLLSAEQKTAAKTPITAVKSLAAITDYLDGLHELRDELARADQAVQAADAYQSAAATKQNFALADDAAKQAFATAKDNLATVPQLDFTKPSAVRRAVAELQAEQSKLAEVKEALNGDKNLQAAKEQVSALKAKLGADAAAQDAALAAANQLLEGASSPQELAQLVEQITKLAQANDELQAAISSAEAQKQQPEYQNSAAAKQQAWDEAITAAQKLTPAAALKDASAMVAETAKFTEATKQLHQPDKVLDGTAQLEQAKRDAKAAIAAASNLNQNEKDSAQGKVDKAATVVDVAKAQLEAAQKDAALQKDAAEAADQAAPTKLKFADPDQAQAYQDALSALKAAQDEAAKLQDDSNASAEQLTTAAKALDKATSDLAAAQKALTGEVNLQKLQEEVEKADFLTTQQKQDVAAALAATGSLEEAKDRAANITDVLAPAQKAILKAQAKPAGYTDASAEAQQQYDQAYAAAQKFLQPQSEVSVGASDQFRKVEAAADKLAAALQQVEKSAAANKLTAAKQAAKKANDKLNGKETTLKEQTDQSIDQANDVAEVNNALAAAVKQSVAYKYAEPAAQAETDQVLADPTAAADKLDAVAAKLDGQQTLAQAKQKVAAALADDDLRNQAANAVVSADDVDAALKRQANKAELNDLADQLAELAAARKQLKELVKQANAAKPTVKYTQASAAKQDQLDTDLAAGDDVLATPVDLLTRGAVERLLTQVRASQNSLEVSLAALDGVAALQKEKEEATAKIDSMAGLTDEQKAQLTDQVNKATNSEAVAAALHDAAVQAVRNAIAQGKAALETQQYLGTDAASQAALQAAIASAERMLTQLEAGDATFTDESLLTAAQDILTAKDNLAGSAHQADQEEDATPAAAGSSKWSLLWLIPLLFSVVGLGAFFQYNLEVNAGHRDPVVPGAGSFGDFLRWLRNEPPAE